MHSESDLLGDVLRALRVRGSLLLRESYSPPFAVEVPPAPDLEQLLAASLDARAVAFHLAEKGSFEIRRQGAEPIVVDRGEMVLSFGGQAHQLAHGEAAPRNFVDILATASERLYGPATVSEVGSARITCGALIFRQTQLNPLFAAMPSVLHLKRSDAGNDRLSEYTALLCAEIARHDPAAEYVVERLLEVICAEGIRAYAAQCRHQRGWFRGIADDSVGRALAAFHQAPGEAWSVARLATIGHLSPSRFAARFAEATGMSAMSYLTQWRMNLAMRSLSETRRGIADIAAEVGYESLPAFSRVFKKHTGYPPATYRKQCAARHWHGVISVPTP